MDNQTMTPVVFYNTTMDTVATTAYNPWLNQAPAHKVIEIIYLSTLAIVGSIGNLTVIFSIMLEKRVHSHGNMFVINLAIADLLVTGFVVPTVISNVIINGNSLGRIACIIAGYTVTLTCTCSVSNLTFIAINRYWAVVHSSSYVSHFTKNKVYLMTASTWVWSFLLSFGPLVGWGRIAFDQKMLLCSWDDTSAMSFTFFLTLFALFMPLCIVTFCYWRLFLTVRSSGRWVRSLSVHSGVVNSEQNRRSMRKESNLLQTLATTVAFYCICWLPYGFTVLIDPINIPALPKKIFGWLGLSNSGVNFIIYGVMNPVFRRGYRNLYYFVFRCQRKSRLSSTALHGSHSDSLYRSNNPATRRNKSNQSTPNLSNRNSMRVNANIVIHRDSCVSLQAQVESYSHKIPMVWSTTQYMNKSNSDSLSSLHIPYLTKKNHSNGCPSPLAGNNHTEKSRTKLEVPTRENNLQRNHKKKSSIKSESVNDARSKRNSLMLLQIQTDESDDMMTSEHRRTQSEIPSGVEKPMIKKRSFSSVRDSGFQGNNFEKSSGSDSPVSINSDDQMKIEKM